MMSGKNIQMHSVQRYGIFAVIYVATSFHDAANFKQKMLT